MSDQVDGEGIETVWRNHCRSAVQKFIMNAVVIDNQPVLGSRHNKVGDNAAKVAQKSDDGMDAPDTAEDEDKTDSSAVSIDKAEGEFVENSKDQDLDIIKISDAFASEQIACAFVFPQDSDDADEKFDRIVNAALSSDIVIIDWYLTDKNDPVLTTKVLRRIAEKDTVECGRMRFVCVYTGQKEIEEITRDAASALEKGGLKIKTQPEKGKAEGDHLSLLVLNKQDVDGPDLPDRILDAFTELSDGLLPSFALAAVAAVRRNMHHIITRFSQDLDAAYVANRLITDPPGDVAELIRELFVSECDTALGLEKVADNYLEAGQIEKWLNLHRQPLIKGEYQYKAKGEQKTIKIDRKFLDCLLEKGVSGRFIELNGTETEFDEKKREKISHVLHDGKKKAKASEQKFARFVALKREACGKTKMEGWVPSLTLGTLLCRHDGDVEKYFYCLTPACDTLRLQGKERTFLAIELFKAQGKTNLVVAIAKEENIRLFIDPRPTNIRTFCFKGSEETGRVMAERTVHEGRPHFTFTTSDENQIELTWIGEVRKHRANRDMADLNRMWLRFGINDSEYLRLAGRGMAVM